MAEGNNCLLRANGITKRLHTYFTLRDIDITLNHGEVCVLLGENGAGKTTLVRILTGDIPPDRGKISVRGQEVRLKSPQQARSLGISIAHQEFILFPDISTIANLFLCKDPGRGSLAVNDAALEEARGFLEELNFLSNVNLKDKAANLSAGQRKQLQIAAAIIQDSPIVILDDPTSYLSDGDQACLFDLVNKMRGQGKAILYACHRVDEAKRVADRVVVLRNGEIVTSIEDKSLISSANLLRGMIGVIFQMRPEPGLPIDRVSTNVELELGYKPEDLTNGRRNYEDIIYPADRGKAEQLRCQFTEQGVDHFEREYRIVCASGDHKWVHELNNVVRDDRGEITAYEIGIVDITEASRAQEALQQSEQKYESLVNNIANVIYSSLPGGKGTRIFLSPRWQEWTGQPNHDIYRDGQVWLEAVHPEDRDIITQAYEAATTAGTEYCLEYRLVHQENGQVRCVRDEGVPVKNESGRVMMFDGILSDITEVKQLEIDLRQSQNFLSGLIMNATVPMLVLNKDYSIRYANPALEELTGFSFSEIMGQKPPYPWYADNHNYKPTDGQTDPREEFYQKKNGERFWVEISGVAVTEPPDGKFFLETWNDITREKRFADNLRSYANLMTKTLEDERKRLARELHDDSIQALFCLCTDIGNCITHEELPPKTRQTLKKILEGTGGVMDSLRSLCHEMRPSVIDRFGLVPAIKLLIKEMDRSQGPDCHFDIIGEARRLPNDTELAIFRILQEALHNVRRHAKASRVEINGTFDDDMVEFTISDNGVGFEMPTETDSLASYGKLGLIGMNERTYLIGGTLSIKSQKGQGTKITLQVPVSYGNAPPSSA